VSSVLRISHGSIVIPQILEFAVFEDVDQVGNSLVFNFEYIKKIFQERQRELMLLLSEIDTSQFVMDVMPKALVARSSAAKWLSENPENNDQKNKLDEQKLI
jgi:hypothetical protein